MAADRGYGAVRPDKKKAIMAMKKPDGPKQRPNDGEPWDAPNDPKMMKKGGKVKVKAKVKAKK